MDNPLFKRISRACSTGRVGFCGHRFWRTINRLIRNEFHDPKMKQQ